MLKKYYFIVRTPDEKFYWLDVLDFISVDVFEEISVINGTRFEAIHSPFRRYYATY
jgi:hypothetical protein